MLNYTEAKQQRDNLEATYKDACKALAGVSGGDEMNLTPEHVKQSAAYRTAKRIHDIAFAQLREFNSFFVRTFKKEIRQERRLS